MNPARQQGITWIETCVLVCVVGSVSAVFIPTFWRSLRISKEEEAVDNLALMHARMTAYFDRTHGCLPASAPPFPEKPTAKAKNIHFESVPAEMGGATWKGIGFELNTPTRYRYSVTVSKPGCKSQKLSETGNAASVSYVAEGDLDGDGQYSRYERTDRVSARGRLEPSGILSIKNALE